MSADIESYDTLKEMCPAMVTAVNAVTFITRPEVWPQFAAWMACSPVETNRLDEQTRQALEVEHIQHLMFLLFDHSGCGDG